MPKERIASLTQSGYMHPMVCWGPAELAYDRGEQRVVRLFAYPSAAGGLMFHPDHPEAHNLKPGEAVGPIYSILDEAGVDHLIAALRRAKRQTWPEEVMPGVFENSMGPSIEQPSA